MVMIFKKMSIAAVIVVWWASIMLVACSGKQAASVAQKGVITCFNGGQQVVRVPFEGKISYNTTTTCFETPLNNGKVCMTNAMQCFITYEEGDEV